MYNEPDLVKIKDKTFRKILSSSDISKRISQIADSINRDYRDKELTLLSVLKGGMPFSAEMMKYLNPLSTLEFVRAASYGSSMQSCGEVKLSPINFSVESKHILIMEDIAESGRTLRRIVDDLIEMKAADVAIATLCRKPRKLAVELPIRYNCFDIEDEFVVGFGMDYDEIGRNFPAVYQL